jgi:hypothetical protein
MSSSLSSAPYTGGNDSKPSSSSMTMGGKRRYKRGRSTCRRYLGKPPSKCGKTRRHRRRRGSRKFLGMRMFD